MVEEEEEYYIIEAFWVHVKDKTHMYNLITKWVGWDPEHTLKTPKVVINKSLYGHILDISFC